MPSRNILTVASALLLALLSVPADSAGLRCRSDPLVLLSNGTIIDLSADVATLLWNIEKVEYKMRVPAGVYPVLVLRTPNWPTTVETFTVIGDAPAGRYDTETVVTTRRANIEVRANLIVKTPLRLALAAKDGWDSQVLPVGVTLH